MDIFDGVLSILRGIELVISGLGKVAIYGPLFLLGYGVFWVARDWWQSRVLPSASEPIIKSREDPEMLALLEPGPTPDSKIKLDTSTPALDISSAIWDGYLDAKIGVLLNILRRHGMPIEHAPGFYEWLGAPVADFGYSAWTTSIVSRRWVLLPGIAFRSGARISGTAFSKEFLELLPSTNLDLPYFADSFGIVDGSAAIALSTGKWIADSGMGQWKRASEKEAIIPMGTQGFDAKFLALPLIGSEMLGTREQHFLHRRELQFFNWEGRPAVVSDAGEAFVVPRGGSTWEPCAPVEVNDSGTPVSAKMFGQIFSSVPPLPPFAASKTQTADFQASSG